jgi:hypothetical protein
MHSGQQAAQLSTALLCSCVGVRRYGLQMTYITNPDFKAGLIGYLRDTGVAATLLGTRRYLAAAAAACC